MKRILLLSAFAFITSLQLTFAQVVINKSDFPIQTNYVSDWNNAYPDEITLSLTGENQVWDISNLEIKEQYTNEYFDAKNDDFYTDATYYVPTTYALNQFIVSSFDFYKIDDAGYTKEGRRIVEMIYPITQLTGGPKDNLKIVAGNIPFTGRLDYIQFPSEFGKTWTQSYTIATNYELTVEAYGMVDVPGQFTQTHTQTRAVVGSGKLTLPNKDGGVMTIDALLVKVNNTSIDSVYLGGQPAPPQLISAFNLEQGAVVNVENYVFYSPGYGFSIAAFDFNEKYISYQSLSGTTTSVESNFTSDLNIFPNPVKVGSNINIVNSGNNISKISIIDQTGKLVNSQSVTNSKNISFELSNSISTGVYILQASDADGNIVNTNKIVVE